MLIHSGERGIRTLETVSRGLHTFQACAFDHSATSPLFSLFESKTQILRGKLQKILKPKTVIMHLFLLLVILRGLQ